MLWLQNFLCQRQRKNQQEQYCEQTSSIYYVERIPPLGYIMNLYQLQIRKTRVEKILLKDTLYLITLVFDQGPNKQIKTRGLLFIIV